MAYREFDRPALDRRALLRGGALLAGGAVLAGTPLSALMAQPSMAPGKNPSVYWPSVNAFVSKFVDAREVANIVTVLGWGQQPPTVIAKGNLAIGQTAPAGLDSLYRIYSMTKPITGMAAMMLIDEGLLGLDQPVAEILPAYGEMMVQKTYDGSITDLEPAKRPITIRNLLTHTAGLGYGIVQRGPIKDYFEAQGLVPGQVTRLPIPELGRSRPVEGLMTFADRLAEAPLVYQPGTKWSYSVGLDLMGAVIQKVTGRPFDEFLKEKIFDPCGMTSTWFRVPESEVGRLTTNYGIMNGMPVPIDPARASIYLDEPAFPFGGAGLVSSPRDYDRFLRMLLGYGSIDGKRVMSELAVRVGTSNLLPEGVDLKGSWIEGQGFGAGGRVTDGAYGWGGAAGTVALVSFKAGLRAGMFTQYMPSDALPISSGFPDALQKDLAAMEARKTAA
ncbi:serine hydrolase domain-containing protein [Qipengyuania sp.]|uniref:serine hydrolase domain-containing protein n=1 Tax=Qipengyuania sp. TaxID=2004515 RepID=UPI0035C78FD3